MYITISNIDGVALKLSVISSTGVDDIGYLFIAPDNENIEISFFFW